MKYYTLHSGCWFNALPHYCKVTYRYKHDVDDCYYEIGFRLIKTIKK